MPAPNLTQASQKLSQLGDYVFTLNTRQEDWIPFAAKAFAISVYYDIVMDNLIDYSGSITVGKEVASFQIIDGHLFVYYTDGSVSDLGQVVGPKGDQGDPGRGITNVDIISGDLYVYYSDGTSQNAGSVAGPEGRGIESCQIVGNDLVITYTDSTTQNVGTVVGRSIVEAEIISDDLVITYSDDPTPVNLGKVVGDDGRGITSVTQPSGPSTAQVNYTSGSPDTINLPAGPAGANGDRYATTSTTSFSIPSNNQQRTFTVGTGLAYTNEQTIIVATTDGSGHHWHGVVDSYNPTTGVIVSTCEKSTGSGTYASWQVNLSGAVGQTGNGIASITQPDGTATMLITYTDGGTQTVNLPNAMINPNNAEWNDNFFVLETTQWSLSNSAATNPAIAVPADTNESGAIAFTAASTNATATIIRVNNQYALTNNIVLGCAIRIGADIPSVTDDYSFVMSVWAGASVDPTRWAQQIGIRIVRSGANAFFQAICRNTTETTVTDVTAITANTTYTLQFRKTGSSVVFYVNGAVIATINTNVPTTGMANIIYRIQKIAGTASRTVQQYQHYERLTRTSLLNYANI